MLLDKGLCPVAQQEGNLFGFQFQCQVSTMLCFSQRNFISPKGIATQIIPSIGKTTNQICRDPQLTTMSKQANIVVFEVYIGTSKTFCDDVGFLQTVIATQMRAALVHTGPSDPYRRILRFTEDWRSNHTP